MKQGQSLSSIAGELERQLDTRKDFLAPTNLISMSVEDEKPVINGLNGAGRGITEHAHGQFSDFTGIPRKYYDRVRASDPNLLATNVNHWLSQDSKKRMIRTLDGNVRAFLSDRYRPLDNYDLAETALPILQEKGCKVESAALTDTRLYIKATLQSLQVEVANSPLQGDVVQAGIVISNSEVGAGSVRIEPMIYRLVCQNGMIAADSSIRKYHVGRGHDVDDIRELLTSEARMADDKAFWLKVRDLIRAAFDRELFCTIIRRMEDAAARRIVTDNLTKVVEIASEKLRLSEGNKQSVLRHLVEGGDLSQYGMVNAITRTSQDVDDYDEATELERAGGKLLELDFVDWDKITRAAKAA